MTVELVDANRCGECEALLPQPEVFCVECADSWIAISGYHE